ncbi:hypothetical protein HK097_003350 [Rhizophlyctis rosea]|uniref:Shugoshin C-terminal domain-containing protein n=1 Tax=Rhizophlyctis rosea TaxID=64517 RepID=A0AAD5WZM5_9FUNG|nr:hypothetical protein HK097_003350 [Rhizophlyctis rosea]
MKKAQANRAECVCGMAKDADLARRRCQEYQKKNNELVRVNALYATQMRKLEDQRSDLASRVYDLHATVTHLTATNERLVDANSASEQKYEQERLAELRTTCNKTITLLQAFMHDVRTKADVIESRVIPELTKIVDSDTEQEHASVISSIDNTPQTQSRTRHTKSSLTTPAKDAMDGLQSVKLTSSELRGIQSESDTESRDLDVLDGSVEYEDKQVDEQQTRKTVAPDSPIQTQQLVANKLMKAVKAFGDSAYPATTSHEDEQKPEGHVASVAAGIIHDKDPAVPSTRSGRRQSVVSYATPSLRSKLRQGDQQSFTTSSSQPPITAPPKSRPASKVEMQKRKVSGIAFERVPFTSSPARDANRRKPVLERRKKDLNQFGGKENVDVGGRKERRTVGGGRGKLEGGVWIDGQL